MTEFKTGDKVQLKDRSTQCYKNWSGVMVVDQKDTKCSRSYLCSVVDEYGNVVKTGAFFELELELCVEFKVGDKVQLKDQTAYNGGWSGSMVVNRIEYSLNKPISAINKKTGLVGAFRKKELELYVEPQVITMEGKWAQREDPTKQVRVLCVDAGGNWPIAYLSSCGEVYRTKLNGLLSLGHSSIDLVPLEEPPLECWVNVYPAGPQGLAHSTKELALSFSSEDAIRRAVHLREVKDE